MPINNGIINQKGTPAFYSDIFANRPAFGYAGRVFISTDTGAIYEDTGTSWTLIADAGAGTTGTLQQVTTNGNTTTLGVTIQGIDINDGAGTGTANSVFGIGSLQSNTTGSNNTAIGYTTMQANTFGNDNTAVGVGTLNLNTTGSSNTAIGKNALLNNTTGNYSTSIGDSALKTNTTGGQNIAIGFESLKTNINGNSNTAIGNQSLSNSNNANYNTAVGYQSLFKSTSASFNTAIGSNSLQENTTGVNNTAVGYASMTQNTTASNNTALGYSSLNLNTTGTQNTAIGRSALEGNLTGGSNVAVGYNSLAVNSSGSTNTAIGVSALASNQTAGQNTAVGNSSMSANTTGSLNTAVGQGSMQANTTGQTNTAVGTSSMLANTTGTSNTAIGYLTLGANTTSNNNTAIGYASLQVNTGAGNTGIGYGSLSSNTSGSNNVAIGNSALIGNTTASNNTAIGTTALGSATTGTQNTAIGLNAGVNITTGGGNTFLGYNSGFGITTGSNNTILGYAGTLSAALTSNIVLADGLGNVRLFSDANGLIGINQAVGSVPGGQLDIHTSQTYALVLNGLTTSNAYTAFSNNSVGKWRIGNTYNAGANSFDIYNLTSSSNAVQITAENNVGINCSPTTFASNYKALNINAATGFGSGIILKINNAAETNFYAETGLTTLNIAGAYSITGSFGTAQKVLSTGFVYWGNLPSVTTYVKYNFNVGANQNIGFRSSGGLATIEAVNDGVSANIPIQFAGSQYVFGSGGNVIMGSTTDLGYRLQVNGKMVSVNEAFTSYSGANGSSYGFLNSGSGTLLLESSGVGYFGSFSMATGIYTPTSDINKKKDFEKSTLGLNAILSLKPTLYRMKSENNTDKHLGFIAQEVKEIIPQAFVQDKDFIGLNFNPIVATLVKAIQELNEKLVRNNIN
jgi:hypothetical protein